MAQTKRKRRTKHRGNAAGVIEARGRTGRKPTATEKKQSTREQVRQKRLYTPPTWQGAIKRAGLAGALIFIFIFVTTRSSGANKLETSVLFALIATLIYIPGGYFLDRAMYQRRIAKRDAQAKAAKEGKVAKK